MNTMSRHRCALLVSALVASMAASQARAWNPPDPRKGQEDRLDLAECPKYEKTPPYKCVKDETTLLKHAHGYITQNGISILYNDGYWFAAQMLRYWQQELLNGVRYADVYEGISKIATYEDKDRKYLNCNPENLTIWDKILAHGASGGVYCKEVRIAPVNHFHNPDTGRGLDFKPFQDKIDQLVNDFGGSITYSTPFSPFPEPKKPPYPIPNRYCYSALEVFNAVYDNALKS
jgi:hypothetical protein